jgi:hypothetical protein
MRFRAGKITIYSFRFLGFLLLLALVLFFGAMIIIQQPGIQTWLVKKAATFLSERTQTTVSVEEVEIRFFNKVRLKGLYLEDKQGDTLAYIRHLDTRLSYFNPFKSRFYFNTLSLDGVRANLYRAESDSTFNYQFLLDALLKPATKAKEKQPSPKSSNSIDIRINAIHLTDISLAMDDRLKGQGHFIALHQLKLGVKEIDLPSKIIRLKKLQIDAPNYTLIQYKPSEKDTTEKDTFRVNIGWKMSAEALQIKDGHFGMEARHHPKPAKPKGFDTHYMHVHNIELQAKDFRWDSLMSVDVKKLEGSDKADNIDLKKLQGKLAMHDTYISAQQLDLRYNSSVLKTDARIDFGSFADFGDFLRKVNISADIRELTTRGEDVGVWYKDAAKYIPQASMSGSFRGTVSNIAVKNLIIQAGTKTLLSANVSVKGLPDTEKMMMDAEIKQLISSSADLKKVVPFLKLPQELEQLGNFKAKGSFKGQFSNFQALLDLSAAPGNLFADVKMQFGKRRIPTYSGIIRSSGVDLKGILNKDFLGNIAFDLKLDGKGFDLEGLDTRVDGYICDVDLNYYRFNKIDINGHFKQKLFRGNIHLEDECALFDFRGMADFNDSITPHFIFSASIHDADLQQLKLLPEKLIVNIDGDFEMHGKDINNITGVADLKNIKLQNNQMDIGLSDIQICLEKLDDYKQYTINSEDVHATLRGFFDPLTLPVAMQYFLSQHTNLLDAPGLEKLDDLMILQDLDMNIELSKDFGLISLLVPKIKSFSDVKVAGSFHNQNKKVNLDISFDSLNYDNIGFSNFSARLYDRNDSVIISGNLSNINLGKINVRDVAIDATSNLTGLYAYLRVENDTARNALRLLTAANFNGDSITISFPRSLVRVNNKNWTIAKDNRIQIVDSLFTLNNFTLKNEEQEITITNNRNLADASVDIRNLNLADLAQIVDTTGLLSNGFLSGKINVRNVLKSPEIEGFVTINDLIVYGMAVDIIGLDAKLVEKDKNLLVGGFIEDDQYDVQFNGRYSLDPNEKSPIDVDVQFDKLDLGFLAFPIILGNEISDLKAFARGRIKVSGGLSSIGLDGKGSIIDTASVKINFLGSTIKLANEDVVLKPKSIEIFKNGTNEKRINIFDSYGNIGTLEARLEHQYFKDFEVFAKIRSDRFNFLNTTYKDNELFFGKVFAGGEVDISGPVNNISINITARSLPGTDFNIVVGGTEGDKMADFVSFVNRSSRDESTGTQPKVKAKSPSNLNMNMNIIATPDAEVKLYMDYAANDVIKARGNGDLNLAMRGDNINMTGEYTATSGEYLFSQQDVINKKFLIRNGSTITWSGDMMDASMNVDAFYSARPSMSAIVDSSSNLSNRRFPVDALLKIRGTLSETEIDFGLEPSKGQTNVPDELQAVLDRVNSDKNQRTTQAFALILFNSFLNLQTGTGNESAFTNLSINTLTEFFNAKVSEYFNDALEMLLPGTEVSISQGIDNTGVRITRKMNNERLIINLGGDVQYNRAAQFQQTNTGFIGDVELEYLVTEDGRVRLRAYSRYDNTIIRLENESYLRTGAGITYQKEFNRFNQLFIRENKGKRKSVKPPKPENKPEPNPTPANKDLPPQAILRDESLIQP